VDVATTPIGPYAKKPLDVYDWDPRTVDVARRVAALINERRPDLVVEHTGSSSVPGLPGKNVVDLGIETTVADVPAVTGLLLELGFQPQDGAAPWPPTRPLLIGSMAVDDGDRLAIHAHVLPRDHRVFGRHHARDLAFRDRLRADDELRNAYAARKREIIGEGVTSAFRYSLAKNEWIRTTLEQIGLADPAIMPPATIGILGGGQLGRMIGLAARSMGYRLAVLDPDPDCPAAAIADEVVVGDYGDVEAALRLGNVSDVITYELEHVAVEVVDRLDWDWPVRPGILPLKVTQNRLAERRFLEAEGAKVAPWRAVRDTEELRTAIAALGAPVRVKAATGGYDGRGQVRVDAEDNAERALAELGRPDGELVLVERELPFSAELSIVCCHGIDVRAVTYPVARNRHDRGILIESAAPAPVDPDVAAAADRVVRRLAVAMGLEGTLTAELFLMDDGQLVVNELAPRVHNTGHWTVDACRTSQFEQHVRAITGLPLGSVEQHLPAAIVNTLGTGARRPARVLGVDEALADSRVRVELYDKREVFERRKMGHVVAVGDDVDDALGRARTAAEHVRWADT